LLRANMRHAGALRIDHVMGLARLYWIPEGMPATAGAYVSYPLDDLCAALAEESTGQDSIVVGEDLGTVPDALRGTLRDTGVMSYRVLYFERRPDGGFKRPDEYPPQALVCVSTHDLPTLRGFFEGTDLAHREALGLLPSDDLRDRLRAERDRDRTRLREAIAEAGFAGVDDVLALHRYVARTPCALMTLQLEDVFGESEQANLPATTDDQHPNWRRKVGVDLEDWPHDRRFAAVCAAIRDEGRGQGH
jgi:4-alpha-glucanotransferase/(1->4)-alpha-D-glucan 1-alpha-D-glucosylmutase